MWLDAANRHGIHSRIFARVDGRGVQGKEYGAHSRKIYYPYYPLVQHVVSNTFQVMGILSLRLQIRRAIKESPFSTWTNHRSKFS
jgi:hypothetical protein